jgi:glycosyltransferase involved in cell wall biosynthesis
MYNGKTVSVVLPAYNEEEGIAGVIREFQKPWVDEIIVVDNNCTDHTAAIAEKVGARVVKQPKQGYGYALIKGMESATGDLVFLAEADSTYYGDDMKILLEHIDEADMVMGTRTDKKLIEKGAKMNSFLYYGNKFVAKLIQLRFLGKVKLSDVGCTFRVIKRDALNKVINQFTVGRNSFSPEMIVVVLKNNLKILEFPVRYRARVGQSKITSDNWKSFKLGLDMIKIIFTR